MLKKIKIFLKNNKKNIYIIFNTICSMIIIYLICKLIMNYQHDKEIQKLSLSSPKIIPITDSYSPNFNNFPNKLDSSSISKINYSDNKNINEHKPILTSNFVNYDDIIGMSQEKESLGDFIDYIQNYEEYHKNPQEEIEAPKGVLFYGVPGTGKTLLTRSLAKKINEQNPQQKADEGIVYFELQGSDFSKSIFGQAPQKVRTLFSDIRNLLLKSNVKSAILFIDECEEVFQDISHLTSKSASDIANVVNAFKSEITSLNNDKQKPIFIIGATNHKSKIDNAILSRLTYKIQVYVGNLEERKKFLKMLLEQRKHNITEEAQSYLFDEVNNKIESLSSQYKSNRFLNDLINIAALNSKKGRSVNIRVDDIKKACEKVFSSEINFDKKNL